MCSAKLCFTVAAAGAMCVGPNSNPSGERRHNISMLDCSASVMPCWRQNASVSGSGDTVLCKKCMSDNRQNRSITNGSTGRTAENRFRRSEPDRHLHIAHHKNIVSATQRGRRRPGAFQVQQHRENLKVQRMKSYKRCITRMIQISMVWQTCG